MTDRIGSERPATGAPGGAEPRDAAAPHADGLAGLHELYRRQFLPLTRLAAMFLGDRAGAQDVVQDVFLSLQRRWHRLAPWPESRIVAYARRAVVNGARSALRHRSVVAAHAGRVASTGARAERATAAEESALARIDGAALRAAVMRLPRRQREVVLLRYLLDLSAAETARSLGVSVSAVTSSAARGVAALRDTWERK